MTGAERFVVWAIRWESSLHDDADFALDCLQESFDRAGLFGDAWRAVSSLCSRTGSTRALLALGELAEELTSIGGHIRPWPGLKGASRL